MSDIYQSSIGDLEFEDAFDDTEFSFSNEQIDYSSVVIWGTDWTLETIANQIVKGNIDLNPHFQRRDAWNETKKSALVESFIIGMPVPPIILAEKKTEKGKYLVIDGKQRLLTICQFCTSDAGFDQLRIKNLAILKNLNGKTYANLDTEVDLATYKNMFDNQTMRTVVIKNWPNEEFLYSIFLRLNTGMVMLSPQELRQALHSGEFLTFLDTATAESKQFHRLLKNDKADSRMRDIELALRAFAWKFYFEGYKGNFKLFLDDTCRKLNVSWATDESDIKAYFLEIENAIDFVYEIFGAKAFSKPNTTRYAFNRALYEVLIYYFSIPDVRKMITKNMKVQILEQFNQLCDSDKSFFQCISSGFSHTTNIAYRFEKIHDLITSIVNIQIPSIGLDENGFTVK